VPWGDLLYLKKCPIKNFDGFTSKCAGHLEGRIGTSEIIEDLAYE
jgi:hypothetical protein